MTYFARIIPTPDSGTTPSETDRLLTPQLLKFSPRLRPAGAGGGKSQAPGGLMIKLSPPAA